MARRHQDTKAIRIPATIFVVLALCGVAVAEDSRITWAIEGGCLTARDGVSVLLGAVGLPADVTLDDKPLLAGEKTPPETRAIPTGFEVRYVGARGELIDRYDRFPALNSDAWLRTLTYTNRSGLTQYLTGADLRVAPVPTPGGTVWNPQWFWMGEVAGGRAACVSYRGSTDYYRIDVDREGRPAHHIEACWRLAPGQEAVIGAQGIWIGAAGREAFREEAARWFSAINLRTPDQTPPWLYDAILYECSAGGHIDTRFSDVGGFDRLARQADYLADLGVSAVWLQAVHEHKTPPDPVKGGWNLYDPRDFSKIDAILGGPEALKRLTDALHHCGIHILGELVPHGGRSVQAMALEPWWTYQRDGSPQRNWGGCGMDYSSPEWQAVMRDHAAWLARSFGVEGARIDVADGSGPNWKSPRTNQASFSTLAGSLEMLQAIRAGFQTGQEGAPCVPVLIPENVNTVEHFAVTPVAYGHSTTSVFAREVPVLMNEPSAMAAKLREFFERERGFYPAGACILRTLNNHDTVCETGRVQYRYGAGLARALYGVCLMVPGIPMMYQEEEIGAFESLRRLNWARRRIPEFGIGAEDYLSIDFAPEVFACLRSGTAAHAVGLSNLSGKTITGTVRLPDRIKLADDARAYDAVSNAESIIAAHTFPVTLGPYETALFRIGRRPEGDMPAPRYPGETLATPSEKVPFQVGREGDSVVIHAGRLVARIGTGAVTIDPRGDATEISVLLQPQTEANCVEVLLQNADRWWVSGRTALLEDRVMRRHFPFPAESGYHWDRTMAWMFIDLYNGVAPTGRLWQSLLEPLHPEKPAIAFADVEGNEILLSEMKTNAHNIVLTDRTDEGFSGPYGLALRFYAVDPDLNPRIAAVGLGQPWTMDHYPAPGPAPLQVSFTVSSGDRASVATALSTERLPVSRGAATVAVEGKNVRREPGCVWFVEPGTVTWSDLVPVPGQFRIRLELRHSESSEQGTDLEDAYELRVDGEPAPLNWTQHNTYKTGNAYFGYAMTPSFDLGQRGRTISVTAREPWCALRGGFHLVPEETR